MEIEEVKGMDALGDQKNPKQKSLIECILAFNQLKNLLF